MRCSMRFPIADAQYRIVVRVQTCPRDVPCAPRLHDPSERPSRKVPVHHDLVDESAHLVTKNVALSHLVNIPSIWGQVLGLNVGEDHRDLLGERVKTEKRPNMATHQHIPD